MHLFIFSLPNQEEISYLKNSTDFDFSLDRISVNNIPLLALVCRKIRFYGCPEKHETHTLLDKIKRQLIRLLRLDIQKQVSSEILLFRKESPFSVYHSFVEARNLYSFHFSGADVFFAKQYGRDTLKYKKFIRALLKSHPEPKDKSTGKTYFINQFCVTLLEAYRTTHPNRKIILRIVDGLLATVKNHTNLKLI